MPAYSKLTRGLLCRSDGAILEVRLLLVQHHFAALVRHLRRPRPGPASVLRILSLRRVGSTLGLMSSLALVGLAPGTSHAYKRANSDHGVPLSWGRSRLTIALASAPRELAGEPGQVRRTHAVLQAAAQRWAEAAAPTCKVELKLLPLGTEKADIVVETLPSEAWTLGPTIAAHTDVDSTHQGAIQGVRIRLNDSFKFDDQDPVAPERIDLPSVLTHELGHALGLAHSFLRSALMRAGAKPGGRKRALTDDDRRGLCAVFGERQPPQKK